jgi:hypothetical protein
VWAAQLAVDAFVRASKTNPHSHDYDNTIEAQMQQFVDNELSNICIPHSSLQDESISCHKAFMALQYLTIPLIVGRRAMTLLSYNSSHAQSFIELATYVLQDIRKVRNEVLVSSSCRQQLTSTVTSVLLVFGAVVLRDLSSPDLSPLQLGYGDYAENFMETVAILSDLAQGLPYAKRARDDCSTIISAVTAIVDKWHSLSHAQKASHGWSFAVDMIPPGIVEHFPYQALCPPLHGLPAGAALAGWEGIDPRLEPSKSGVLWLF